MIRSPSVKRLCATFELTREQAQLIKRLCALRDDRNALEVLVSRECPDTDSYTRDCYRSVYESHMWRTTIVLHAIDHILGTCGVEALGDTEPRAGYAPEYEYCNTGDAYASTLIYRRASDNLFIGSWATIVERMPRSWSES